MNINKLTLDDAWRLCVLEQWPYIIELLEHDPSLSVHKLKEQWVHDHGYRGLLDHGCCPFCAYDEQQQVGKYRQWSQCEHCPGKLVDPDFKCNDWRYHFAKKPFECYEEVKRLYAIYLKPKTWRYIIKNMFK